MIASATPGAFSPTSFVKLNLPKRNTVVPLPMSPEEALERGWDEIDIVFVTGDAYIDHPSFAMAILGRVLEANGFRVGILAQPAWQSCNPWKQFGRPRLFYAISAGNMDSMINHYTANKKVRNDDAYSPGGRIGLRPDRATSVYCQRAREAFKGVPIIAGGVEASLRRLAHYDYWSDTVKRSILLDSKADLVAYGMGESTIVEIARRLQAGDSVKDLRDMRGMTYVMGAREQPPSGAEVITLPSFEIIRDDKPAFAEATRMFHVETNPYNAKTLVQMHDRQAVVCNPPRLPESSEAMDYFYDLPYTRKPHPSYKEPIPAFQIIKESVTIMRGCFGGCTYCSITAHQGRIIQSRSKDSIVREVAAMGRNKSFKGIVSDLGGPTANMYKMRCQDPKIEALCRRQSCVHPTLCSLLGTDHEPLIDVMKETRSQKGVRKVLIASGVRMDLAQLSPKYMRELASHHVGGHLKVAPENTDPNTLTHMRRPSLTSYKTFAREFERLSKEEGKEQYLVPYFISSHPGSDIHSMIDLALFLKRNGYKPEQVQDFIPAPMDVAACMYHTGLDPFSKKPVHVDKFLRDRKLQRALMQFFEPRNYFLCRKALIGSGRGNLIGQGCDCLIPSMPPQEALDYRRQRASHAVTSEDHVHSRKRMPKQRVGRQRGAGSSGGYRPQRRSANKKSPG